MSAHTPGPWETFPNGASGDERLGVQSRKGPLVADCGIASNRYSHANARLIAAAPDMLAALRKFTDHYPSGINPSLDEAFRKAHEAIDKAEGRS